MVYISCKPTSLARDLSVLIERGYKVKKTHCVDMFPGTVHVETVVLLSKGESTQKIQVEFSLEDMDMSGSRWSNLSADQGVCVGAYRVKGIPICISHPD